MSFQSLYADTAWRSSVSSQFFLVFCENGQVRDFKQGILAATAGVMLVCSLVWTIGCEVPAQPKPLNELNKHELLGRTVFQGRCGVCHNDRKAEALHGPALVGVFKKPALPSGAAATDERVTATIHNGHGLMPPLGDTVDPEDLQDLLAYLHTL
jgi:mono/diheme cytochrome c family protein